jgi:hypothetical protein
VTLKRVRVPGFLPSENGFLFENSFPDEPLFELSLGFARVPVGNAHKGVCGGMVMAARDLFEANLLPPSDRVPPEPGSALYRYLVRRLFDSFNLPGGPFRYLAWMWLPAGDTRSGLRGLSRRTIGEHWPRIRADLDGGVLCPLGLVRARTNPFELGRNHQALAYGYDLDVEDARLSIQVYDPNHPVEDDVALSLSVADPARPSPVSYVEREPPVYAFFRTRYSPGNRRALASFGRRRA